MFKREALFKYYVFFVFFISKAAMAFSIYPVVQTAYMNSATFPKGLGNIVSAASDTAVVKGSGSPDPRSKDTLKISAVTFNPDLSGQGFELEVKVGASSWMTASDAVGKCIWVDANCTITYSHGWYSNISTQPVSVRLVRNSSMAYSTIPAGTLIASMTLLHYSSSYPNGFIDGAGSFYFKFDGDVTPIVPTCDVKNFDKNVTLPDVKRTDLVNHGTGRYTSATKEFNINLECENSPKVSVIFDGDKMSGVASEDVLVNKLTGNENIGVQILYNSNPLKIGEKVAVLSSAGANEALKFNAYYYFKGGTVQSGTIKSQTEFTFSYE